MSGKPIGNQLADLREALALLEALVEFAEQQSDAGVIDGSCDPAIHVHRARRLLREYRVPIKREGAEKA